MAWAERWVSAIATQWRQIIKQAELHGRGLRSLIHAIVESETFATSEDLRGIGVSPVF